jgi:hypothetical protein
VPLTHLLLIGALSGTLPTGGLRDIFDPHNPRPDPSYMLTAPIVVVATVQADTPVGTPRPAERLPSLFLQEHEVTCSRENVLKGEVGGPVFRYYYFAVDTTHVYSRESAPGPIFAPTHRPQAGKRYVLFLKEDAGVLRSVGDVFDYSEQVLSGCHPDSERRFRSPVGAAIAEILLTPGIGHSACFLDGQQIELSRYYLTSKAMTAELIEPFLHNPDAAVRACACQALAYYLYPGYEKCVFSILKDPQVDKATKQRFRERFKGILGRK